MWGDQYGHCLGVTSEEVLLCSVGRRSLTVSRVHRDLARSRARARGPGRRHQSRCWSVLRSASATNPEAARALHAGAPCDGARWPRTGIASSSAADAGAWLSLPPRDPRGLAATARSGDSGCPSHARETWARRPPCRRPGASWASDGERGREGHGGAERGQERPGGMQRGPEQRGWRMHRMDAGGRGRSRRGAGWVQAGWSGWREKEEGFSL